MAFSPRDGLLATDAGSHIRLWRTDNWTLARPALPLADGSMALVLKFSPDGQRLACMSSSPDVHEVTVWEVNNWTVSRRIRGVRFKTFLGAMDFSPDSNALTIGNADCRLQVVDLANGNTDVNIPEAHSEGISALAWSRNGSVIASGSAYSGGPIRLWDARAGLGSY